MAKQRYAEFGPFTWHDNPNECSHQNDDACPTCDHDHYYRNQINQQANEE